MKHLKLLLYDFFPSLKEWWVISKEEKSRSNSADSCVNCIGKLEVSSPIPLRLIPVEFASVQGIQPSARKKFPHLLKRL